MNPPTHEKAADDQHNGLPQVTFVASDGSLLLGRSHDPPVCGIWLKLDVQGPPIQDWPLTEWRTACSDFQRRAPTAVILDPPREGTWTIPQDLFVERRSCGRQVEGQTDHPVSGRHGARPRTTPEMTTGGGSDMAPTSQPDDEAAGLDSGQMLGTGGPRAAATADPLAASARR